MDVGRQVPNWFFYWNQTTAGDPDLQLMPPGLATTPFGIVLGDTPKGRFWESFQGPVSTIRVSFAVVDEKQRSDGSFQTVSGIDLFANIILHENRHVQQILDNNKTAFFKGVTGSLSDAPGTGWSFLIPDTDVRWNHFSDVDGSGALSPGDVELDEDRDDLFDPIEPSLLEKATCVIVNIGLLTPDIECQAGLAETSPEDTFFEVDWGDPGKQHRTRRKFDD